MLNQKAYYSLVFYKHVQKHSIIFFTKKYKDLTFLYYEILKKPVRHLTLPCTQVRNSSSAQPTLRVWFWQCLSSHQMHHCCFAKRKF